MKGNACYIEFVLLLQLHMNEFETLNYLLY